MWKAAFSGRSETGSVSGRSNSQKKKSSGSSVVSSSTRDERRKSGKSSTSRGSTYDDYDEERSAYATAPSSRVGEPRGLTESAVNALSRDDELEWEDEDKDARSERRSVKSGKSGRSGRSELHRRKSERSQSRSQEREREREKARKEEKRKSSSRRDSELSRGKARSEDVYAREGERAIPDMGSFEQFPGQYAGGMMGQAGQADHMMSGGLSGGEPPSAPNRQFGPTREDSYGHASSYYLDQGESVHYQPGVRTNSPNMLVNPDHHLHAASLEAHPVEDTGQGSAADFFSGEAMMTEEPQPISKPGKKPAPSSSSFSGKPSKTGRTSSLGTAAAATAAVGLAGAGAATYQNHQQQSSSISNSYQQQQQAGGSLSGRPGRKYSDQVSPGSGTPQYAQSSQQQQTANGSYYGTPPRQPSQSTSGKQSVNGSYYDSPTAQGANESYYGAPPRQPSQQQGANGSYYGPPPGQQSQASSGKQNVNGSYYGSPTAQGANGSYYGPPTGQQSQGTSGKQKVSGSYYGTSTGQGNQGTPTRPGANGSYYDSPSGRQSEGKTGKHSSHQSNAGMYAAGAAAAGAAGYAAYEMNQHHEQKYSQSQYGGTQYSRPSPGYAQSAAYTSGSYADMQQQRHFHEHKGPMTKLKDGFLNLLSTEEDVVKMEAYTEAIGVCKHCFDPRSSPWDAPRRHHYHSHSPRRDSFEDLRRRRSLDRLRKHGSREHLTGRVDKDSRYYASESKRKSGSKSDLAAAGLAGVGLAAGANALFNSGKDFEDTYSVKSGHRPSSAVRRRSRSSSRERRRKSTHGVIGRGSGDDYVFVRTKDGRTEKRRVQRSRSRSNERRSNMMGAAAGAALGASAIAASGSRRRRSRSRSRSSSPGLAGILGFSDSKSKRGRHSPNGSYYGSAQRPGREQQQSPGMFGGFFTSPPPQRRNSKREHRKKKAGFFNFGNGSSSSSDNEMAFGDGFSSKTNLPLKRKSSNKNVKRKGSDHRIAATVAGIGATAAALAAVQKGNRISKRTSRPELGAKRRPVTHQDSSDEDWEDELPSDASSGSSLAFGDYENKLSRRQSKESVTSNGSGAGGLGAWGWRWGGKKDKKKSRVSSPPPAYPPRADSSFIAPAAAAGIAAVAAREAVKPSPYDSRTSSMSGVSQPPLQYVDPRPVSETSSITSSNRMPGAFDIEEPPVIRPGPGPIQQPKPIAPIQPAFTDRTNEDMFDRPKPRRTMSSPTQSSFGMRDAALIGAAAIGTASIIAGSQSGRGTRSPKDVRFGLTEEQQAKEEREKRKEREKAERSERAKTDRERALKQEAERFTREQDVLRRREEENRRSAEVQVEREREAERLRREREAEALREKERQEVYRREEARKAEEVQRQEAYRREEARKAEELQRQEEARRRREAEIDAEIEAKRRELEEEQRRSREKLERRESQSDRKLERRDSLSDKRSEKRDSQADRKLERRDSYGQRKSERSSSVPWGAVAAGTAAAATAGAVYAGVEHEREKDRIDARDREQAAYTAREVAPTQQSPELADHDVFDPAFFKRRRSANRSPSGDRQIEEIARKAFEKIQAEGEGGGVDYDQMIAEKEDYYHEPQRSQVDVFAPKEILERKPGYKEHAPDPIGDNEVRVVRDRDGHVFDAELYGPQSFARSRHAPFGVPKLELQAPTPPPELAFKGKKRREQSPLSKSEVGVRQPEKQFDEDVIDTRSEPGGRPRKSSRSRSISWGEPQTHVYEPRTPESFRESQEGFFDAKDAGIGAAAAGVAAAVGGAAVYASHDGGRSPDDRNGKFGDEMDGVEEVIDITEEGDSGYRRPFFESVSDLGIGGFNVDSPGTEGAPPVQGFIEGEVDATPKEERGPRVPGGWDDEQREGEYFDSQPASSSVSRDVPRENNAPVEEEISYEMLSKKDKKKRDKAKRASMLEDEFSAPPVVEPEPEPVMEAATPVEEEVPYEMLSKKDKKKRDKAKRASMLEEDLPTPPAAEPEPQPIQEPTMSAPLVDEEIPYELLSKKDKKKRDKLNRSISEDMSFMSSPPPEAETPLEPEAEPAWEPPLSKKEQKKREKEAKKSGFADVAAAAMTTAGIAAAAGAAATATEDDSEAWDAAPSTKKGKKGKKSKQAERDIRDMEPTAEPMPGSWEAEKTTGTPPEVVNPFQFQVKDDSPPDTTTVTTPTPDVSAREVDPMDEFAEVKGSSKKSKKKAKRDSLRFNEPEVSSPLRSEVAFDDYFPDGKQVQAGAEASFTNGHVKEGAPAEEVRPAAAFTAEPPVEDRTSRSTKYEVDDRPLTESPRRVSPDDTRSVASEPTGARERRRRSKSDYRASEYYEEGETDPYDDVRSVAASEPADLYERRKSKRRSRTEDDDTASGVSSSRSRREKEKEDEGKKEKKSGFFGGLFGKKSSSPPASSKADGASLSRTSTRESKDGYDEDGERRHRRRRSEYGDDGDDTRSVASESRRRKSSYADDDDTRSVASESRRRKSSYADDDDTRSVASESRHRHHHRRRTDEEYPRSTSESGSRPHHHRRRTDDDFYAANSSSKDKGQEDQSFLGMRVEGMPPLPADLPASSSAAKGLGSPGFAAREAAESGESRRQSGDGERVFQEPGETVQAVESLDDDGEGEKDLGNFGDSALTRDGLIAPMELTERNEPTPGTVAAQETKVPDLEEAVGHLPALPESPPDSPTELRQVQTPHRPVPLMRPTSTTAVPLRFPFGQSPSTPGQNRMERSISFGGHLPSTPTTPHSSHKTRQARPTSGEIMPLYLVERSRKTPEVETTLPSLPSSKTTSRASSVVGSDEYESAAEEWGSPLGSRSWSSGAARGLAIDTESANAGFAAAGEDYLDSQQTTPRATERPSDPFAAVAARTPGGTKQEPEYWTWKDFEREQEQGQEVVGPREKAEPQFYTWEDYERDEALRRQSAEPEETEEDLPALPPSRPQSRTERKSESESLDLAKGVAAAAAIAGGAAVLGYNALRGSDDDDEGKREIPSDAAATEPETEVEKPSISRAASSSSKKKGKKGKKGKKQQEAFGDAPEERETPEQPAAMPPGLQNRDAEAFVKSEKTMEEGDSVGEVGTDEYVEPTKPNELDRSLGTEESVEEGDILEQPPAQSTAETLASEQSRDVEAPSAKDQTALLSSPTDPEFFEAEQHADEGGGPRETFEEAGQDDGSLSAANVAAMGVAALPAAAGFSLVPSDEVRHVDEDVVSSFNEDTPVTTEAEQPLDHPSAKSLEDTVIAPLVPESTPGETPERSQDDSVEARSIADTTAPTEATMPTLEKQPSPPGQAQDLTAMPAPVEASTAVDVEARPEAEFAPLLTRKQSKKAKKGSKKGGAKKALDDVLASDAAAESSAQETVAGDEGAAEAIEEPTVLLDAAATQPDPVLSADMTTAKEIIAKTPASTAEPASEMSAAQPDPEEEWETRPSVSRKQSKKSKKKQKQRFDVFGEEEQRGSQDEEKAAELEPSMPQEQPAVVSEDMDSVPPTTIEASTEEPSATSTEPLPASVPLPDQDDAKELREEGLQAPPELSAGSRNETVLPDMETTGLEAEGEREGQAATDNEEPVDRPLDPQTVVLQTEAAALGDKGEGPDDLPQDPILQEDTLSTALTDAGVSFDVTDLTSTTPVDSSTSPHDQEANDDAALQDPILQDTTLAPLDAQKPSEENLSIASHERGAAENPATQDAVLEDIAVAPLDRQQPSVRSTAELQPAESLAEQAETSRDVPETTPEVPSTTQIVDLEQTPAEEPEGWFAWAMGSKKKGKKGKKGNKAASQALPRDEEPAAVTEAPEPTEERSEPIPEVSEPVTEAPVSIPTDQDVVLAEPAVAQQPLNTDQEPRSVTEEPETFIEAVTVATEQPAPEYQDAASSVPQEAIETPLPQGTAETPGAATEEAPFFEPAPAAEVGEAEDFWAPATLKKKKGKKGRKSTVSFEPDTPVVEEPSTYAQTDVLEETSEEVQPETSEALEVSRDVEPLGPTLEPAATEEIWTPLTSKKKKGKKGAKARATFEPDSPIVEAPDTTAQTDAIDETSRQLKSGLESEAPEEPHDAESLEPSAAPVDADDFWEPLPSKKKKKGKKGAKVTDDALAAEEEPVSSTPADTADVVVQETPAEPTEDQTEASRDIANFEQEAVTAEAEDFWTPPTSKKKKKGKKGAKALDDALAADEEPSSSTPADTADVGAQEPSTESIAQPSEAPRDLAGTDEAPVATEAEDFWSAMPTKKSKKGKKGKKSQPETPVEVEEPSIAAPSAAEEPPRIDEPVEPTLTDPLPPDDAQLTAPPENVALTTPLPEVDSQATDQLEIPGVDDPLETETIDREVEPAPATPLPPDNTHSTAPPENAALATPLPGFESRAADQLEETGLDAPSGAETADREVEPILTGSLPPDDAQLTAPVENAALNTPLPEITSQGPDQLEAPNSDAPLEADTADQEVLADDSASAVPLPEDDATLSTAAEAAEHELLADDPALAVPIPGADEDLSTPVGTVGHDVKADDPALFAPVPEDDGNLSTPAEAADREVIADSPPSAVPLPGDNEDLSAPAETAEAPLADDEQLAEPAETAEATPFATPAEEVDMWAMPTKKKKGKKSKRNLPEPEVPAVEERSVSTPLVESMDTEEAVLPSEAADSQTREAEPVEDTFWAPTTSKKKKGKKSKKFEPEPQFDAVSFQEDPSAADPMDVSQEESMLPPDSTETPTPAMEDAAEMEDAADDIWPTTSKKSKKGKKTKAIQREMPEDVSAATYPLPETPMIMTEEPSAPPAETSEAQETPVAATYPLPETPMDMTEEPSAPPAETSEAQETPVAEQDYFWAPPSKKKKGKKSRTLQQDTIVESASMEEAASAAAAGLVEEPSEMPRDVAEPEQPTLAEEASDFWAPTSKKKKGKKGKKSQPEPDAEQPSNRDVPADYTAAPIGATPDSPTDTALPDTQPVAEADEDFWAVPTKKKKGKKGKKSGTQTPVALPELEEVAPAEPDALLQEPEQDTLPQEPSVVPKTLDEAQPAAGEETQELQDSEMAEADETETAAEPTAEETSITEKNEPELSSDVVERSYNPEATKDQNLADNFTTEDRKISDELRQADNEESTLTGGAQELPSSVHESVEAGTHGSQGEEQAATTDGLAAQPSDTEDTQDLPSAVRDFVDTSADTVPEGPRGTVEVEDGERARLEDGFAGAPSRSPEAESSQPTEDADVFWAPKPKKKKKGKKGKQSTTESFKDLGESASTHEPKPTMDDGEPASTAAETATMLQDPETPAAAAESTAEDTESFWAVPAKGKKTKKGKKGKRATFDFEGQPDAGGELAAETVKEEPDTGVETAVDAQVGATERDETHVVADSVFPEPGTIDDLQPVPEPSNEEGQSIDTSTPAVDDATRSVQMDDASAESMETGQRTADDGPFTTNVQTNADSSSAQERPDAFDEGAVPESVQEDTPMADEPTNETDQARPIEPEVFEPSQPAPTDEDATGVSMDDASFEFTTKKSKKDKKKTKKSKSASADQWTEEPSQTVPTSTSDDAGILATAGTLAAGALAAGALAAFTPDTAAEEPVKQEDDEWPATFSTKKSKKDKRKGKKSGTVTPLETEPRGIVAETTDPDQGRNTYTADGEEEQSSRDTRGSTTEPAADEPAVVDLSEESFKPDSPAEEPVREEDEEWPAAFSTKKSKKDKRKGKRSGIATPAEAEPAGPAAEPTDDQTIDTSAADAEAEHPSRDAAESRPELDAHEPQELDPPMSEQAIAAESSPMDQNVDLTQDALPLAYNDRSLAPEPQVDGQEPAHPDGQRDIDFAATVAAGLHDSGFDPEMVVNDPVFHRRATPPRGTGEADPEEVFESFSKKKKKKGKKGKQAEATSDEQSRDVSGLQTPRDDVNDFDEVLARSLEGTGIDPTALDNTAPASDETPSSELTGDGADFSFATTRRKKGKKKARQVESEQFADMPDPANMDMADPSTATDEAPTLDAPITESAPADNATIAESSAQDVIPTSDPQAELSRQLTVDFNTTEPTSAIATTPGTPLLDPAADLIHAGDRDMDVDDMDKAYRAYKRNKRKQKKQKWAAMQAEESANETPQTIEETPRTAEPSERIITANSASNEAADAISGQREVDSIEQSDFAAADETTAQGVPESSTYSPAHGEGEAGDYLHTSEMPQSPPTAFDQKPSPSARPENEQTSEDDERSGRRSLSATETVGLGAATAAGVVGAGALLERSSSRHRDRSAHSPQLESKRSLGLLPNDNDKASTWSFDDLEREESASPGSPVAAGQDHQVIRDSGYQETKSPRLSRQSADSSKHAMPDLRAMTSKESLHSRRSNEALYISTDTGTDWDLKTPKKRGAGTSSDASRTLHARTPSQSTQDTPLESTSRNRASYLFQTTPENLRSAKLEAGNTPTQGSDLNAAGYFDVAEDDCSFSHADRTALSPPPTGMMSPRIPLHTIPEEHLAHKRSIGETDAKGPDHKASRRTETPQAIRARERALSPTGIPPLQTGLASAWTVSNPGIDELARPSDMRSPSVLSSRSNVSANHWRSPDEALRSYSRTSNRSNTPSLRRTSLSGDLRAASLAGSRRGDSGSSVGAARSSPKTIPFEAPPTPPSNDDEVMDGGASRSVDMSDVYQGYGDAQGSQVSPTRPPSMRKRQSMHIMDLESRLEHLAAENEALQSAKQENGSSRGVDGQSLEESLRARDIEVQQKDTQISQIRAMLQPMQNEIARLTELNEGLTDANRNLVDDSNSRYATLQQEHDEAHEQWQSAGRELDGLRQEHGQLTSGLRAAVEAQLATALASKNTEIRELREELDEATEKIRALQVQIQSTRGRDFLTVRDEDYFDGACQKLCQHVQQWVLRFSKVSDNRICRLSTDLKDDKVEARLDNAVLDGSDVDKLLGDRVRRRDIFMSVVMTMVWEFVFTRYLFGMDREQRQKLKSLEKLLSEVGPSRAVAQWRATTLTLLAKRPSFAEQRDRDEQAVAHEVFELLEKLLPPPSSSQEQLLSSLQRVIHIAVDLSIEMRTQRSEYIMLPPLLPEYDTNGDLMHKVHFNASLMNERSGMFSSNEELEQTRAVVKIVLFPLVVKKGDESGEGEDEIVVCPAQVLVHNDNNRGKKVVRVESGHMTIDDPRRSRQSLVSGAGSNAF